MNKKARHMTNKVLLTGASGFIGKHTLLRLLQEGYEVVGTVRTAQKADLVKKLMAKHGADTAKLSFELLDLTKDDGWNDVVSGCRYVQHIASPFPLKPSKDREALVPPAKEGALRVLNAAIKADVERYVFTASVVSMMHSPERPAHSVITEQSWTDPEWNKLTAYIVSKTRAELAVWEQAEKADYKQAVTSIHPGLVLGPALDRTIGTSLEVIKMFLQGKYPALPKANIPIVDVRDVAQLHLLAQENAKTGGRRLLAADKTLSLVQIASILKKQFPDNKKIPRLALPDPVVRFASLFDPSLKALIPDLGRLNKTDTQYVKELTGHELYPSQQAVTDAAKSLYNNHILP